HAHAATHVAQTFRTNFLHDIGTDPRHLRLIQGLWQKLGNHTDLMQFLVGKVVAAILLIDMGRFLALLDHAGQDFHYVRVVDGVLTGTPMRNVAVLDGSLDQPERRGPALILLLDRTYQCLGDFIAHLHFSLRSGTGK